MLTIKLDARPLIRHTTAFANELPGQLKNGVNRAGTAARTAFLEMLPKELNVKNPRALRPKGGQSADSRRAGGPNGLTHIFIPSRRALNLIQVKTLNVDETAGELYRIGKGLTAATNVLSGGGSSHLHAKHGFILHGKNGDQIRRRDPDAPYKWGTVKGSKAMNTASPSGVMGQEDNPVRKKWELVAETELVLNTYRALEEVKARAGA